MRQIKFRGLRTDTKEWVYGSLLQSEIDVNQRDVRCQIHERFAFDHSIAVHDVIPESVGQFIGLQDKNKVDIYEGDIGEIKTQSGRIERFIVKWGIHRREMKSGWTTDIPGFCFEIDGFPSFPIAENYVNGHDLDIIAIIGSIHTHPELLKEKI